eukprot:1930441-Amphidinium_carterae.1
MTAYRASCYPKKVGNPVSMLHSRVFAMLLVKTAVAGWDYECLGVSQFLCSRYFLGRKVAITS